MNFNDIAIGQRVARFTAPPSAVPKRGPAETNPNGQQDAPDAARAVPSPPLRPANQNAQPAPATPAATVDLATPAIDTTASLEAARKATEQTLQALEAERAAKTPAGVRVHIDEATQRVVAEVLNNQREVIRQLPPEELLRIAARLDDVVGLIFDRRV